MELEILEKGNLSNAVLEGALTNKGRVANLTITKDGHLTGGIVTGYIVNDGLMENFEFQGASIIGGTLGGIVTNLSEVKGYFQDVHLASDTHIMGGAITGNIIGDINAPALLENVEIRADSHLVGVILGNGVTLADNVTYGEGVQFLNPELTESTSTDSEQLPSETSDSEQLPSETKDSEELPSEISDSEELPSETKESEELPSEISDSSDSEELPPETKDSEELPILESAIAVNANGEITKSKALFSGGIAINTGPFESSATVTLSDGVDIRGRIDIATEHQGQVADSLVVVAYQPRKEKGEREKENVPIFLMLDENGEILPWDFDMSSLVTFQTVETPTDVLDVPIYQGQLPATGIVNIYFGYRLNDGTVIYSPQTLDVTITE